MRAFVLSTVMLALASAVVAEESAPAAPLGRLDLIDDRGESFDMDALRGRATIVAVWATWCPSCRQELPELIALGSRHRERGLELLLVSVDRQPRRGARYLEGFGYEGARAFDPGARSVKALGIEGIPTVLVLDARGRVTKRITGASPGSLQTIEQEVDALLGTSGVGEGHVD